MSACKAVGCLGPVFGGCGKCAPLRVAPNLADDPTIRRAFFGPEQADPVPPRLASGALPDVRDLPLADRREVFLDGLRALTKMTGVVVKGAAIPHGGFRLVDGEDDYTINQSDEVVLASETR